MHQELLTFNTGQVANAVATQGGSAGNTAFQAQQSPDTKANWPTDGFRLVSDPTAPSVATQFIALALKGSFSKALGATNSRTSTGTTNLSLGATPRAGIFWGHNQPTATTLYASASELGAYFVGFSDGTNQSCAGYAQLDNSADSQTGRWHSNTRAIQEYAPNSTASSAPTLMGEASLGISGTNFVADWQDADTIAREYNYCLIGA